jgi:hypothetical protein
MVRGLLARLVGIVGNHQTDRADQPEECEERDSEDSGFMPSRLDASVLEGHGMETTQAEQELTELQKQAEQLEEQDRER